MSNTINNGNSQNTAGGSNPHFRSQFPLSFKFFDTHRFGEYHPHYVEEGVKNDKLPVRSSHNVMSYTLKSPLIHSNILHEGRFKSVAHYLV